MCTDKKCYYGDMLVSSCFEGRKPPFITFYTVHLTNTMVAYNKTMVIDCATVIAMQQCVGVVG